MNCEQYRRYFDRAGFESRERSTWSVLQADEHSTWSVFRDHERDCPACAALAQERHRFDTRLRLLFADVPVPPGGPAAVVAKLRSGVRRRARQRAVQFLAIAASLVIAVGSGYAWRDARAVAAPDQLVEDRRPELAFDRWAEANSFSPIGLRFERKLYASEGPVEIRPGLRVPSATLSNPDSNATAHIYILSTADIPEGEILDLVPSTPLVRYRLFRDAGNPDIRYLVLYTGSSFDAFRMPPDDI